MKTPVKIFVRLAAAIVILTALTVPAKAATSIFASSVFSTAGAVTNSGDALGPADTVGALLGTGGDLVLGFSAPLTGAGISLNLLPIGVPGAVNIIALSIGEVIGGVATFSSEFVLVDMGSGGVLGADLSAQCSALSATGCSLVRIRNAGALFGSLGLGLDAVSGVTNVPEPSVWALMVLSFGAIGWRIKKARKTLAGRWKSLGLPSSPGLGAAPAW